jgi:Transglutaminase-like domain
MRIVFFLLAAVACGCVSTSLAPDSDEPDYGRNASVAFKAADSLERSMRMWKTPEDVNAWIAANFSYDRARAIRLSETQRSKQTPLAIYTPSEFFDGKSGVCVDLARFAVETLRQIDPDSDPKYLMIEFDPVQIEGNTLRLHWLVSFKRAGKIYFFADSKRPGYIAGPYNDAQAFIDGYRRYRARTIIAFRELPSYQKQRRERAPSRPVASNE